MTTTTTTSPRYLTDTQIASYHREGYLALPRFLDAERVEALRRVTDAFVERSRSVARTDAIFDLDPRHTAAAPVVRRIKNPADRIRSISGWGSSRRFSTWSASSSVLRCASTTAS